METTVRIETGNQTIAIQAAKLVSIFSGETQRPQNENRVFFVEAAIPEADKGKFLGEAGKQLGSEARIFVNGAELPTLTAV